VGWTPSRPVDTVAFPIVVVVNDKRGLLRSGRQSCRPGAMASVAVGVVAAAVGCPPSRPVAFPIVIVLDVADDRVRSQ